MEFNWELFVRALRNVDPRFGFFSDSFPSPGEPDTHALGWLYFGGMSLAEQLSVAREYLVLVGDAQAPADSELTILRKAEGCGLALGALPAPSRVSIERSLKILETEIREQRFQADVSLNYYREIGAKLSHQERIIKILQAFFASSAILSWGVWSQIPQLFASLLAINTVLSVLHPFLNWEGESKDASAKYVLYVRLFHDWDSVLRDLLEFNDKHRVFEAREKNYAALKLIQESETNIRDQRTLDRVHKRVSEEHKKNPGP